MRERFRNYVHLVTGNVATEDGFQVALESMEGGTGALIPDKETAYESGTPFKSGDVLFGKLRPYLAKVWLSDCDGFAVGDIHVYRPRNDVWPAFLKYVVLDTQFIRRVDSATVGAKMPRAEWSDIREIEVEFPSLVKQRAIADFLDRETAQIDAMIEAQEQLAALFVERGQAEIDNTFRASPGTEIRRVGHLLTQNPRYGVLVPQYVDESDPEAVPFIRVGDLASLHSEPALHHIEGRQAVEFRRTRLMGGEVLLGVVGKMGQSALVPHSLAGANVARAVAVLRCHTDVEARLLALWLKSRQFLEQAVLATSGDTIQPTLGMGDLSKFEVHWPTGDLVKVLEGLTDDLASTKNALTECHGLIALLRERREALITAAVTGRIDTETGIERTDPITKEAS